MPDSCPFCEPDKDRIWYQNHLAFVLWDAYPVSDGHALVVPKQHVESIFDLTVETQTVLWKMVADARHRHKRKEGGPDGFNIGLNDSEAAGQTIEHAHIHVIPRWNNDVPDPRGGIRWVIPEKAQYWSDE